MIINSRTAETWFYASPNDLLYYVRFFVGCHDSLGYELKLGCCFRSKKPKTSSTLTHEEASKGEDIKG